VLEEALRVSEAPELRALDRGVKHKEKARYEPLRDCVCVYGRVWCMTVSRFVLSLIRAFPCGDQL
jgi:hypothetical protein